MSTRKYTKDHEWIEVRDDGTAVVGITDHAQEQLGELVFVELPDVGRTLAKGEEAATVESVKAASEVYAGVGGEIVEVNAALADTPELVNSDAEGGGWLYRVRLTDTGELEALLDRDAYDAHVAAGDEA